MGLSNALRAASRGVSSSAYARMALPALTAPAKKPSMMSAIFGQSAGPAMPPMDQPVPGLVLPDPPAAPAGTPQDSGSRHTLKPLTSLRFWARQ